MQWQYPSASPVWPPAADADADADAAADARYPGTVSRACRAVRCCVLPYQVFPYLGRSIILRDLPSNRHTHTHAHSPRTTPLPHEELEKVGGNVRAWAPGTLHMYFEIKSHARGWRNRLTPGTRHAPLPRPRALVLTARSCYYWTVHRVLRAEMPRGLLAC